MRRVLLATAILLTAVVVPAIPAAAGGCHDPTPTEARGSTVEMTERCFQPTVLHVAPGTTVRFVNVDEAEHVITGVGIRTGWPTVGVGQSVEMRFDDPGTHTYMCHIHPGMSGAVVVGGKPALASAARPVAEDGDGLAVLPVLVALVVGVLGGVIVGRRRVASAG